MAPIIIVGAGQAGLQTAESLRSEGYEGDILLLGNEAEPPYHRPPLSKEALSEGVDAYAPRLFMRSPEALARKRLTLRTGITVAAIDRACREVVLAGGERLAHSGLCLATGARNRLLPLPGADTLAGVMGLRTLDDARHLGAALEAAPRVVIIGGGFIGLEVAAAARKKGCGVTVLEAAPRLMARVVAPVISEVYAALHRGHGVTLELGAAAKALHGENGAVRAVEMADGRALPADLVVYGIGILPNAELAQAAGLEIVAGGIAVDACARTADPLITAAGDCTTIVPARRLESVQNAVEQGKAAAASLLGRERPFTATPWFWSNQYDYSLQIAGLSAGHDTAIIRGGTADGAFSVFYFRAGRLLAVDSVNQPKDHMAARKLLDRQAALSPEQAADLGFDLARAL